jgi:hypothetical protein
MILTHCFSDDIYDDDWSRELITSPWPKNNTGSHPPNGPDIRRKAISNDYEEDMATIDRIEVIQQEFAHDCLWIREGLP